MPRKIESHLIAGPAGNLESLLEEPEHGEPVCAALVCHPHPKGGGTMHNKVVYRMARALRQEGCVVLRFNYRGVNLSEGEYAHGEGELLDAAAALAWLRARYPDLPFILAGFSFGSRVILRLGCSMEGPQRLIAAGFPTTYAERTYLQDCNKPKIYVHSTKDQYGPMAEFEPMFAGLPEPKKLIWIEAQDHFFAGNLDGFEAAIREAYRTQF